jgi:hypothetical protein
LGEDLGLLGARDLVRGEVDPPAEEALALLDDSATNEARSARATCCSGRDSGSANASVPCRRPGSVQGMNTFSMNAPGATIVYETSWLASRRSTSAFDS